MCSKSSNYRTRQHRTRTMQRAVVIVLGVTLVVSVAVPAFVL